MTPVEPLQDHPLPSSSSPIAAHVEVAVVGAGPAGLAAALELARSGANVSVFEQRPPQDAGHGSRSLGIATVGLTEGPHRLTFALGDIATREIYQYTDENLQWLAAQGLGAAGHLDILPRGGIEGREVDDARAAFLRVAGTESASSATGEGWRQSARWVDPVEANRHLSGLCIEAGARVHRGIKVVQVESQLDHICVELDCGERVERVQAEAVILAAGGNTDQVLPRVGAWIHPVRAQWASAPIPLEPPSAGRLMSGHGCWMGRPNGMAIVGGCRWASAHMEEGERDDRALHERIQVQLDLLLSQRFPERGETEGRWASIMAHTCDGLPLVGPIPGEPRMILCAGFGGEDWNLAPPQRRGCRPRPGHGTSRRITRLLPTWTHDVNAAFTG